MGLKLKKLNIVQAEYDRLIANSQNKDCQLHSEVDKFLSKKDLSIDELNSVLAGPASEEDRMGAAWLLARVSLPSKYSKKILHRCVLKEEESLAVQCAQSCSILATEEGVSIICRRLLYAESEVFSDALVASVGGFYNEAAKFALLWICATSDFSSTSRELAGQWLLQYNDPLLCKVVSLKKIGPYEPSY